MQDTRICFVGDSFVAGVGDPAALGWCGRLSARSAAAGHPITAYNLGVRRETSADIRQRWAAECAARLPAAADSRIVFSFGVNDTTLEDGAARVAPDQSLVHAQAILSEARQRYAVCMVGPPPIADDPQNARIQALDARLARLCGALEVPYCTVFEALRADAVWCAEVARGDGAHPQAEGYARLSEIVARWSGWGLPT